MRRGRRHWPWAQREVRESGVRLLRSLLPGCVCDGKASKLSRKNEAAVRVVLATKKFGRGVDPTGDHLFLGCADESQALFVAILPCSGIVCRSGRVARGRPDPGRFRQPQRSTPRHHKPRHCHYWKRIPKRRSGSMVRNRYNQSRRCDGELHHF